jgi:formylglycine-generating enzyme required for sulfatase activity
MVQKFYPQGETWAVYVFWDNWQLDLSPTMLISHSPTPEQISQVQEDESEEELELTYDPSPVFTAIPSTLIPLTITSTPEPELQPTSEPTPSITKTPSPQPEPTAERRPSEQQWAYIPAGSFLMGSNPDEELVDCWKYRSDCELDWFINEAPIYEVYLDAYYINVYEVTNEEYAVFLNVKGNRREGGSTWLKADSEDVLIELVGGEWQPKNGYHDHPVVMVSWYGARAYCEWAGGRLPTEAEWEKAARGELEGKKYPWGDESPVCTPGAENGAQYKVCGGRTVPVGTFQPNGYGLYEMAGNVWEWVLDWYDEGYYARSLLENPTGPSTGEFRVLRSGSCYTSLRGICPCERKLFLL